MKIVKNTNWYRGTLFLFLATSIPYTTSAQMTFLVFSRRIIELLNYTTRFVMALALFAFIIGAIRFISTAGDDKSRESGKHLMIWGTVSLFLMVAVWGLVAIIQTTFFGS